MNYNVTPIDHYEPDYAGSGIGMGVPRFGRKASVRNASEKVLFAESHYEAGLNRYSGCLNADGWPVGGVLSLTPVLRYDMWSMPRHRAGFVIAMFDGSARIVPFAQRDALCNQGPSTYPTPPGTANWAVAGWGPNWYLD